MFLKCLWGCLSPVTLDGKPLTIAADQNELDHIVESADVDAELTVNWQKHRADLGESVELQTGEHPCTASLYWLSL